MSVATKARSPAKVPALEVLSGNVIIARARLRLSQVDLAERSGLSRATVSKIENGIGDVNVGTLEQLADGLGCDIGALFAHEDAGVVGDDELARRAVASEAEFVDARDILDAVEEAGGRSRRYSRAGRPRLER